MGDLQNNGGIGRVVSLIVEELCKQHEITIITYTQYDQSKALYHLPDSVKVIGLNQNSSMKRFMIRGGTKRIREIVRQNKIQVLVACGALFFPVCIISCWGTRTKTICWEHSNANNRSDHNFQMLCRFFGAKKSDAVVTLTKQDYKLYQQKYNPKLIRQIYNPVDGQIGYRYSIKENPKRIISVGRLTYQKNYPLLIKVAKTILSKFDDWSWDIYGDGPDRRDIEQLIGDAGLSKKLILKGQVSDIYDRYGNYSFLVNTSRYEGFSMVFLEATRSGLPIVSFDIECGPREIIKDGINGFLINPFDENKMIDAISYLCSNREKCIEFSKNAYAEDEKFLIDEIGKEWNLLFDELS